MFTPVETSIGALLLHQATSVLLFQNGTILGVSGFMRSALNSPTKSTIAFFAGMAASFVPLKLFIPELLTSYPAAPSTIQQAIVTAGVGALVGWGTKLSNGCTSGHMLCGLGRLSARSAIAVATFFPLAILTHHLVHPSLLTDLCTGTTPCYTPTYPSATTTKSLLLLAALAIYTSRTLPALLSQSTNPSDDKSASNPNAPARLATLFLSGLEFGLGLHITQMSHPSKVLSFLSFPRLHLWDPSLALVLLFAVLPNALEIRRRGLDAPPLFSDRFDIPKKTVADTDWKFVLGAAAFGVGWGLTGTCPGPAVLRAVAQPGWGVLWIGGFWVGGRVGGMG